MNNSCHINRDDLIKQKGRTTPSFFDAQNIDNKELDLILVEILTKKTTETNNENA